MNGDRDARPEQGGRPRRALEIHVSGAEARAPAGHRQKRDVDRGELRHLGEEVGVAREVHGWSLSDHEAERLCLGAAHRQPGRRMVGTHRLDAKPADLGSLPPLELLDLESGAAQQLAGTQGRHDPRPPTETAERRDVEVVVMQVRDEDCVEVPRHLRRRAVATEMRHSGAQDRVGEEAHATKLYEHGGVADVCDASGRYAP